MDLLPDPTRRRPGPAVGVPATWSTMPWSVAAGIVTDKTSGLSPAATDRVLVMHLGGTHIALAILTGV